MHARSRRRTMYYSVLDPHQLTSCKSSMAANPSAASLVPSRKFCHKNRLQCTFTTPIRDVGSASRRRALPCPDWSRASSTLHARRTQCTEQPTYNCTRTLCQITMHGAANTVPDRALVLRYEEICDCSNVRGVESLHDRDLHEDATVTKMNV